MKAGELALGIAGASGVLRSGDEQVAGRLGVAGAPGRPRPGPGQRGTEHGCGLQAVAVDHVQPTLCARSVARGGAHQGQRDVGPLAHPGVPGPGEGVLGQTQGLAGRADATAGEVDPTLHERRQTDAADLALGPAQLEDPRRVGVGVLQATGLGQGDGAADAQHAHRDEGDLLAQLRVGGQRPVADRHGVLHPALGPVGVGQCHRRLDQDAVRVAFDQRFGDLDGFRGSTLGGQEHRSDRLSLVAPHRRGVGVGAVQGRGGSIGVALLPERVDRGVELDADLLVVVHGQLLPPRSDGGGRPGVAELVVDVGEQVAGVEVGVAPPRGLGQIAC